MIKAAIYGTPVLAALALAALAGPALLDAERFKHRVAAALEDAFGGAISIDGPLTISAPWPPTLRADAVRVSGGAAGEARFNAIELVAAPAPLIGGEIEIRRARLIGPDLALDGTAADAAPGTLEALARAVRMPAALEALSIAGGRVRYRDPQGNAEHTITGIDLALTASEAEGGHLAEGSARWGGTLFAGAVSLARSEPGESAPLRARLEGGGITLTFRGTALPTQGFGVEGQFTLEGRIPETLAAALAAPMEDGALLASLAGVEIEAASLIRYEAGRLDAREIALRVGGASATGAAAVSTAPPRIEADLRANRVDLDALLAAPGAAAALAELLDAAASPPAGLEGALSLAADASIYRGGIVRGAQLEARFDDGAATLQRFSAALPGRSEIALIGGAALAPGGPPFDGRIEGKSDNLRALLGWLGAGTAEIPADRLRRLGFSAALAGDLRSWSADGVELELDTTRVTGRIAYEAAPRAAFDAALNIDRLDLDAYRAPAPEDAETDEAPDGGVFSVFSAFPALPGETDANFSVGFDALTAAGAAMRDVRLAGALANGALVLREMRVGDLGGAVIAADAAFSGAGDALAVEGALTVGAADAAALARAAPGLPALPAGFGAAALDAAFSGGRDAIALEAEIAARDSRLTISGSIIEPAGTPLYDLAGALDAPDLAVLLEGFGVIDAASAPPLLAAPATARGELFGNAAALAFGGDGALGDGAWALRGNTESAGETSRFDVELSARFPDFLHALRLLAGAEPGEASESPDGPVAAAPFAATIAAAGAEDDFTFDAAAGMGAGALSLSGRAAGAGEDRSWTLDAALEHPDSAGLLSALGFDGGLALRPGGVRFSGAVSGNADGLEIRDLEAVLADSGLRGRLALEFPAQRAKQAKPMTRTKITADLSAGRIAAADFLPAAMFGGGSGPDESFDLSPLRRFDAELSLAADALDLGGHVFEDAAVGLALDDGLLRLDSLAGELFGGSAAVAGRLAAGAPPRLHGAVALRGADAGLLLARAADIGAWRGPVDVDLRFATEGTGKRSMFRALDGTGSFRGADGEIDGFDLAAAAASAPGEAPFLAALEEGSTAYRGIEGAFDIAQGRLRAPNVILTAEGAAAEIAVEADLATRRHRLSAYIGFDAHPDLPPVLVRGEGPFDAPRRLVEFGALARAATSGDAPPEDRARPEPPTAENTPPEPAPQDPAPAPVAEAPPKEPPPAAETPPAVDFDSMLNRLLNE